MSGIEEAAAMAARVVVGLILVVAGWAKVRRGGRIFRDAILAYDLVPRWLALLLAAALPPLEVLSGAGLVLGVATHASALLGFALIAVVSTAVVFSLARGKRHFCGCLGFTGGEVRTVQWSIVYRNLFLMAALLLAVTVGDSWRVDHWFGVDKVISSGRWSDVAWSMWAVFAGAVLFARVAGRSAPGSASSTNGLPASS